MVAMVGLVPPSWFLVHSGTPECTTFAHPTEERKRATTRSRVSHFMNKFRELGYIKYNGDLEIYNSLLNIVLYDKPEIRRERSSF
jgi:hypothetical protein